MTRLSAATLTMLAALTLPAAAQNMSDAERQVFRKEVRDYLMENPEVLMEAIQVLDQRQQAEQASAESTLLEQNAEELYRSSADWVGGNPDGDVTLVEFMDYRCGYCRQAFTEVDNMVKADGNVRFVLKELPILGPQSVTASRFALSVKNIAGDDAYKAVHDAFFTLRGEINDGTLERIAAEVGADWAAVKAGMNSDDITNIIAANQQLAAALRVQGTPTFVIDSQILRGYVPEDAMAQIVAAERKG